MILGSGGIELKTLSAMINTLNHFSYNPITSLYNSSLENLSIVMFIA